MCFKSYHKCYKTRFESMYNFFRVNRAHFATAIKIKFCFIIPTALYKKKCIVCNHVDWNDQMFLLKHCETTTHFLLSLSLSLSSISLCVALLCSSALKRFSLFMIVLLTGFSLGSIACYTSQEIGCYVVALECINIKYITNNSALHVRPVMHTKWKSKCPSSKGCTKSQYGKTKKQS